MSKKPRDYIKENKEQTTYVLFYFFITAFLLKTVVGIMSGSKCLLVSGIFALFGVFIAIVTLIRINKTHPGRSGRIYFNPDKLEFIIVLGISIIIAISTSVLFFSVGHMVFFHTLYPPEILAAWLSIIVASVNLCLMVWIKQKFSDLPEMDEQEVVFALNTDFILSLVTIFTVVVSRWGLVLADYAGAILAAMFMVFYSVKFLAASFKGLMDASCDKKTVAAIEGLMRKIKFEGNLKNLRVNKVGHVFEIMLTLKVVGDISMKEAAVIIKKIKEVFKKKFLKPHEVFVGVVADNTGSSND
ncbi:MAG: cation transporter [Candidatus Omnitrophica bacterium]|nr:cation transporter [Candidatus Omnitrophota bacterium]